jgi:hypothetical protein
LGERASNLFGVLLSLTFFSVLLAVMLVAVSILPDGARLAPPTLPGETESSRPVRTPQPVTVGGLALQPAPVLGPPGPALGQANFATSVIPPPATGETGGPTTVGPRGGGSKAGPGGGVIRSPGSATPDTPGKARGNVKKKGETDHPKRGRAFLRCDEKSASGKSKGRCDGPGKSKGKGHGGGRGKGGSSGDAVDWGAGTSGPSHGGNGLALGHEGTGHGNGHGKGQSKHGG